MVKIQFLTILLVATCLVGSAASWNVFRALLRTVKKQHVALNKLSKDMKEQFKNLVSSDRKHSESLVHLSKAMKQKSKHVEKLSTTVEQQSALIQHLENENKVIMKRQDDGNSSVAELEVRIKTLEENVSRSENDTIAFYAVRKSHNDVTGKAIFNDVIMNRGTGYNSRNGVFTVPPGGDGLYYFSVFLVSRVGQFSSAGILVDKLSSQTVFICGSYAGSYNQSDNSAGSCSGFVDVVAGDQVYVIYAGARLYTPSGEFAFNGFNGFRI